MIFIPILTKSFTIKNVLLWAEKKMCMKIKNKKKKIYIFFFISNILFPCNGQ